MTFTALMPLFSANYKPEERHIPQVERREHQGFSPP
ncbi:hypothetical protein PsAD13_01269 [Pseudovibrio sp. Ad13]|nr:hypothetical protein PsAD13_01269 [Pseudovibrio sp. Ad13]KZK92419.1 hypothetical protein PsW74_05702 [Pseudovibrio sp. W74]KZL10985.1 hypothetical protein PsAD14_01116 [Pseudovibrio sp. Ad14]